PLFHELRRKLCRKSLSIEAKNRRVSTKWTTKCADKVLETAAWGQTLRLRDLFDKKVGQGDRGVHVLDQVLNFALDIHGLAPERPHSLRVEIMLQVKHLVAEFRQNRVHAAGGFFHGRLERLKFLPVFVA